MAPLSAPQLNIEELLSCLGPEGENELQAFDPRSPELQQLQRTMQQLYLQQKEKGGIIDLDEEKNRFLLQSTRVS